MSRKVKLPHRGGTAPTTPALTADDAPPSVQADAVALDKWRQAVDTLGPSGHLQPIDATLLEVYVLTFARWRQLEAEAAAGPLVVAAPSGYLTPNCLIGMANKQAALVARLAHALGLPPPVRERVLRTPPESTPPRTPTDEFSQFQLARRARQPRRPA
jgi:P27 family predicted phage terminase small subunit